MTILHFIAIFLSSSVWIPRLDIVINLRASSINLEPLTNQMLLSVVFGLIHTILFAVYFILSILVDSSNGSQTVENIPINA